MQTPRRLQTEERHAELLSLGRTLFSEQPYDSISIDFLAGRAGISRGLLYHYFKGKRGYYIAVMESLAADITAAITPDLADGTVDGQLGAALSRFVHTVDANQALYRALLRGGVGADTEVDAIVEQVRQGAVEVFAGALNLGLTPRLQTVLYGFVGFAEFTTLHWAEHHPMDAEQLTQLLLDTARQLVVAEGARL